MPGKLLLSVDEAAQRLGISRRALYRLVAAGKLPRPRQLPGRRVAFLVTDLTAWAESLPETDPAKVAVPKRGRGKAA